MRRFPLLLVALFLAAATMARAQEPMFFLESIEVRGASRGSERIILSEARLEPGSTYGENQLRDATARIQRLPFVVSTDFRLAKGTSFGRYVLIVEVVQMKPFFLNAESATTWLMQDRVFIEPDGQFERDRRLNQLGETRLTAGTRWFVGSAGVLNLAATRLQDRPDRYTVSYTQYDLFGTRASITGLVSYLEDPGATRFRNAPGDRNDWQFRNDLTWELIGVIPLAANDSLRGSWQRTSNPISYFEADPQTGQVQNRLRGLPSIRRELFYIHDSTDDPLFPSRGTYLSAGVVREHVYSAGFTLVGHRIIDQSKASAARTWPVTASQAFTLAAEGSDHDGTLRRYDGRARYSFDLWGRERTLRNGDLRLEVAAEHGYAEIRGDRVTSHNILRAGVVFRNEWGLLRLSGEYQSWRQY
jgi:hypothetical protein